MELDSLPKLIESSILQGEVGAHLDRGVVAKTAGPHVLFKMHEDEVF